MRKLVITAALATLMAVPAFVASHAQEANAESQRKALIGTEYGARAQAPGGGVSGPHFESSDGQRLNGTAVGTDPDPTINMLLQRDEPANWN